MVYCKSLVLAAVAFIQAHTYNNPVLSDEPYYDPSARKINGTYYLVATSGHSFKSIFPIHTSTDLVHWEAAGYVFDDSNVPTWGYWPSFRNAEIHQIGNTFVVYFTAISIDDSVTCVGAAIGSQPLGPYSSLDRPIVIDAREGSIINDAVNEKLYLVWSKDRSLVMARQLHSTGLSFASEETITLLKPTTSWEFSGFICPFPFQKGQFHYLFFNAGSFGVGVAISNKTLGPYKKMNNPIVRSNNGYNFLYEVSVVPDLLDENDVIFLQATTPNQSSVVVMATVDWDDDIPRVGQF